jgi:predicted DCC family thiol-disulfide oxidoreductase YuxK
MNALTESPSSEALTSERHPLLLFFDGQCVFCNRWVDRVRASDHAGRMRFGAKQGLTFQQVARGHPEIAHVESVVLLRRRADGREDFLIRSAAVRELLKGLPRLRFFAVLLQICPPFLADLGYRLFAKMRYPLFGRLDHCRIPAPEEKDLFVD